MAKKKISFDYATGLAEELKRLFLKEFLQYGHKDKADGHSNSDE